MALNCSSQYYGSFHICNSSKLHTTFAASSLNYLQFSHSQGNCYRNCNLKPWSIHCRSFRSILDRRSILNCLRIRMAESETSVSSSSNEQVRLLHLKLPILSDDNIKSQVLKTHSRGYTPLLRQPLLVSIQHILKPATDFVDSIILDKKVPENGIELETSKLREFNSALSELWNLGDFGDFNVSNLAMDWTAKKAVQQLFDEINVHTVSMEILQVLSRLSWDEKAVDVMGCFVLKFVEFLGFLLHGPNHSSIELASSMAALKENPVSIVGSPLEKFQQPLDQLNNLIKITLELMQYICELTLLSDTEYSREDLVSTAVYWAVLSAVAGYIQMTLIMDNGEVALDLYHLISNLSHILDDLKQNYTICKPEIEEMEAHMQFNVLFEHIFDYRKNISDNPSKISEFMKRFTYSKDGQQSLFDCSAMSKVDLEVLNGKTVLLLISDLDISIEKIKNLLEIYKEIREEDYYKIVWVPFVLQWTKELRQKFENLKSKTPWYIVCYDSPIAGLWYLKGRLFSGYNPLVVLIDLQHNVLIDRAPLNNEIRLHIKEENFFPFKRLAIVGLPLPRPMSSGPILHALYLKYPPFAIVETLEKPISRSEKQEHREAGVHQNKPSSGFTGLVSMIKRGNEQGGSSGNI